MQKASYAAEADSCIADLLDIAAKCTRSKGDNASNKDELYTAPAFMYNTDKALTLSDIPMQSYSIEKSTRRVSQGTHWNDSIKNLIFDISSVNSSKRFKCCIIFTEPGYKYPAATLEIMNRRYCYSNSLMILVSLDDEKSILFDVTIVIGNQLDTNFRIPREYLVELITSTCTNPTDALVMCHTNSINEYIDAIVMLYGCTWSIQCTSSTFVSLENKREKYKYVCPIYACMGSTETRLVSKGAIALHQGKSSADYRGRLNYYNRCIRGMISTFGKCYECDRLFRSISQVYKTPDVSPIEPYSLQFSPKFLTSIDTKTTEDGLLHP